MSSRFSGSAHELSPSVDRTRLRSVWLLLAISLVLWGLVPGGTQRAAANEEGLELLGRLPQPKAGIALFDSVGIEPVTRRLYLRGYLQGNQGGRLLEYDLTKRIPTLTRAAPLPTSGSSIISPYTVSFDPARKRAFVLDETPAECQVCSVVKILNLETLQVQPKTWNLTLMVPNFYASGITYSAEDNRIYAVGSLIGYATGPDNPSGAGPTVPVMVVAVDATSGDMAWAAPIPKCQYPGVAAYRGGAIFRSKRLSALYVPCVRPEPQVFDSGYYPGTSAVVRLWIDSRAGTNDAVGFRSEIFPISGKYTNGGNLNAMSVFDERADRVYMANNANTTSGAWVFDGLLSAWVGFVPAFDDTNREIGLDQSSGHLYMRSGRDGNLIVTDGRATPVPQGELLPIKTVESSNFYLADPLTHRVFVRTPPRTPGQPQQMLVMGDHTPSATPAVADDYDSLTTDLAEGTGTFSTFAGSVNGFGARITLVGGYGGAMSPVIQNAGGDDPVKTAGLGISPGPRGVALGRVGSIDLQNVGASASAQAVAPDDLTDDEYETRRKSIGQTGGGAGGSAADALVWPWPAAVCLDAGEKKANETKESSIGSSVVNCDLKQQQLSAVTRASGLSLDILSVAGASFDSSIARTASEGTVTKTTAVARGIEVTVPGYGRLSIARVTATVQTLAHGRPGTASLSWTRDIDGVLLTDPSGNVLFRCPKECSPTTVADAVNESLGQRVQISIPEAEKIVTPRGAFASIRKTEQDAVNGLIVNDDDSSAVPALELLIINDSQDKSRLDVQLAAIQASSIYGISLLPEEGGLNAPPLISVPPLVPPVTDLGPQVGPGIVPPLGTGGPTLGTTRSSVLAVRSAADALFISLICVLVFATIAGAVRRHRFAALLNGGSQG